MGIFKSLAKYIHSFRYGWYLNKCHHERIFLGDMITKIPYGAGTILIPVYSCVPLIRFIYGPVVPGALLIDDPTVSTPYVVIGSRKSYISHHLLAILYHEAGHIYHKHLKKPGPSSIRFNLQDEMAADLYAAEAGYGLSMIQILEWHQRECRVPWHSDTRAFLYVLQQRIEQLRAYVNRNK